ncbi:MAG: sensor histidine kinase [Candidatus Cyclobacteriaceae bacterium M2_1C_046]
MNLNHSNRLYWICQIFGWMAFYVIYTSIAIFFTKFSWIILVGYLNTITVGFLLTHVYREIIKKRDWLNLGIKGLVFRILGASFIIGIIWASIVLPVNEWIRNTYATPDQLTHGHRDLSYGIWLFYAFNLSIIALIWSLIYFIYKYITNYKQIEVDKWKLEAAVKDAELLALKSQINPHFMFNCLNNIRSLVIENPEKARDMILHLSDLLRYSLQFSNKEKINLEDELDIVKNYLTLESIQYEDRLSYKLEIHEDTLEMKIPPMAIQLLVENAIKHGISLLPGGGEIRISTHLENGNLIVQVMNTGQLSTPASASGIGLNNAAERLRLIFGQLAKLTVENIDEKYVSARFTVPVLY